MIQVVQVQVADVVDLRARVLRAGRPRESATFEGDDDPGTVALAVFADDLSGPAATTTLLVQACPWLPGMPALRLRGMATDPVARRRGLGAALVAEAIARSRTADAAVLWCHARLGAAGLYSSAGFEVAGPQFEVAGIGPHLHMHHRLRD